MRNAHRPRPTKGPEKQYKERAFGAARLDPIAADVPPPVSIVIVDDHPAMGVGLATIVSNHPRAHIVAAPCSIERALELDLDHVDVIILGRSTTLTRSAADPILRLREQWPGTQVLVIADHDDDDQMAAYLALGVAGFVSKRSSVVQILEAFDRVAHGHRYFVAHTPSVGDARAVARTLELTERQYSVLRMLERGMNNSQMAAAMELSPKTVSSHKVVLQRKVGARNTAQIVPLARALGLL